MFIQAFRSISLPEAVILELDSFPLGSQESVCVCVFAWMHPYQGVMIPPSITRLFYWVVNNWLTYFPWDAIRIIAYAVCRAARFISFYSTDPFWGQPAACDAWYKCLSGDVGNVMERRFSRTRRHSASLICVVTRYCLAWSKCHHAGIHWLATPVPLNTAVFGNWLSETGFRSLSSHFPQDVPIPLHHEWITSCTDVTGRLCTHKLLHSAHKRALSS